MHMALWIAQSILAAAMLGAALLKLTKTKPQLATKMRWVDGFSPEQIRLIGVVEVLAAAGLVLPAALGVLPILVPIAAAALVPLMIGAAVVHLKLHETPAPPLVLGAIAIFVAVGRFAIAPFA